MEAVTSFNVKTDSLTSCTARLNAERNSSRVLEFIASISTFKTVEKISDVDAVNSMPMLLECDAAEWWQGVKTQAEMFDDVVRMLCEAFSPPKPDWRIYAEIFESHQQKN